MSADGRILAAIGGRPGAVRLLTWHSGGRPEIRLFATEMTPPTIDRSGDVFVVARLGRRTRVVAITPTGRRIRVEAPSLTSTSVRELAIAADGSRVAAVVGAPGRGRLVVGRIASNGAGLTFDGFRDVLPSWRDVRGVSWDGAEQLVATAADAPGHRRLIVVDPDGYAWRVLSTDGVRGEPVATAAATGQPLVVVAGGSIWAARASGGWRRVGRGQQPSYPG